MTTGERIRARRKELGITADILAEKLEYHVQQYSDGKMALLKNYRLINLFLLPVCFKRQSDI